MGLRRKYICKDCNHIFTTTSSERIKKGCPACGAHWSHTEGYKDGDENPNRLVWFFPLIPTPEEQVGLFIFMVLAIFLTLGLVLKLVKSRKDNNMKKLIDELQDKWKSFEDLSD